jgi:hypothetical protein
MKITDLNGQQIEVTDFTAALEQAEYFKDCHHIPPDPVADKRQQAYWTDIYNKLTALQSKPVDKRNNKQ